MIAQGEYEIAAGQDTGAKRNLPGNFPHENLYLPFRNTKSRASELGNKMEDLKNRILQEIEGVVRS